MLVSTFSIYLLSNFLLVTLFEDDCANVLCILYIVPIVMATCAWWMSLHFFGQTDIARGRNLVSVCCLLHNFLPSREILQPLPPSLYIFAGSDIAFHPNAWKKSKPRDVQVVCNCRMLLTVSKLPRRWVAEVYEHFQWDNFERQERFRSSRDIL